MAKKIRRVRTFARTATKSMEKNLVENAKKLKENPYLILPEYSDNYSNKYFTKIRSSLEKVHRFKDDTKKLEKLAKKKGLDGALAGTLLIAHSEKAPYLAVAKFPTGEITYAQRGKADKEKLIAVQHFDDHVLRLLGVKEIALKKQLNIYSWDNGYISTGQNPKPPKEFISFVVNKLGFSTKDNVMICDHIKAENAKNKEIVKKHYLWIQWKSADFIFAICEDCTKSTKNTLFNITKYLIEPDISKDFIIKVVGQVIKQNISDVDKKTIYVKEYLSGELSDYDFIKKNLKQRKESIEQSEEKLLILDGVSYGQDVDGFIKALKPNNFEREGLEFMLNQIDEPVIIKNASPNKVLERYWTKYGLDLIISIINNEEMSKKFFSLNDTPSNILEAVFSFKERQQILSMLPKYESLPPLARFADSIARTYKTFGEKNALGEIKKRPDNPKGKSLAYAFLLAFEKGQDKRWQYSHIEIEYGEFLKDYAKKLLDSKPKEYNKALKELLTASGSEEKI